MLKVPRRPRWLNAITLIYGIIAFLLLSASDSVWVMSLLGVILALLCVLTLVFRYGQARTFRPQIWIPGSIILGAAVGAGGVAATMLILLIKMSLEESLALDYPLITGMVQRLTAWTVAGALVGLALAFVVYGRGSDEDLS